MSAKSLVERLGACALIASGVVLTGVSASAAPTTPDRLRNADNEPQNWLMNNGNYSAWRYSKLAQINRTNVANLKVVFMASIGGNGMSAIPKSTGNEQATPLVEDGFMYVADSHNKIMKFDVSSGNRAFPLWRFDPKSEKVQNTLGVALYQDLVIHATRDARIIGIGKNSGEAVFDVSGREAVGSGPNAADAIATRTFRGATTVVKSAGGKDVIVVGGGGSGVGWVGGFDANNGRNLWRTYTIPQPGEPNFGTWPGDKWRWGGAVPWGPSTFDPDTNTIYMGTGEASPVYDPEFRPGDNLYANSTLALDADTGKIKWFFQEMPNDQWDFDATSSRILHDMIGPDGQARKVVTHWERNGFTYTLDRATGEFLRAVPQMSNINWTKGIDPKTGKPVEYIPQQQVIQTYAVAGPRRGRAEKDAPEMCATWGGAPTGIWPAAYDPTTAITYQTRTGGCTFQTILKSTDEGFQPLARENLGASIKQVQVNTNANLIAIDTKSGRVVNTHTRDLGIPSDRQAEVGALVTAGGLVFSGFDDGSVSAYDKDTLVELWRFNVGTGLKAPLITYAIGGKQYVAHIIGGDNPGNGVRALIMPTAMIVVYGL